MQRRVSPLREFDPYFYPDLPAGQFDTIICNYVLNVIDPAEVSGLIEFLESLLTENGIAYITVRRDELDHVKRQHMVLLDLPVVNEKRTYCMYETWK